MLNELEARIAQLPWLESEVLGNAAWAWLAAALTTVVVFGGLRVAHFVLGRVLGRSRAGLQPSRLQGAAALGRAFRESTRGWALFLLAVAAGLPWLTLGSTASRAWAIVFTLAVWLQIGLWVDRLLRVWLDRAISARAAEDPARKTSFSVFRFVGLLIVWSSVLLLALDNMGVDVSALVAGFGIGGIAVALAAQNLLGDLFASLSIVLDRPFEVGDFVIVGDELGVIERIGLKTTRVRSLGGEQITFGNTDLLASRIRNYKRMAERRVSFDLDVVHGTPTDDLREIPSLARAAVEEQENTRFDRAHLKSIAPVALRYEIVYYIGTNDYNAFMDVQQAINLRILAGLEERGVALAHPTYTVHLDGNGRATPASAGAHADAERDPAEAQGYS